MSELRFVSLFSGSSGNCEYIKYRDTEILIDAGKSARAVAEALSCAGADMRSVSAIFVTHEHSDHISGIPVISRKYGIPVHMTARSASALPELPPTLRTHGDVYCEKIGDVTVTSFVTPHDSFGSVGYVIDCGGTRIGVATDMGYLADGVVNALMGCSFALIESNYDAEMLKNGPYPPSLKRRIASTGGHLQNESGAVLASVLAACGADTVALGHLSAENNTPALAYDCSKRELCRRGVSTNLVVAARGDVTVIYEG